MSYDDDDGIENLYLHLYLNQGRVKNKKKKG